MRSRPAAGQLRTSKKLLFACVPLILLLGCAELLIRWTGAAEICSPRQGSPFLVCHPLLHFKTKPGLVVRDKPVNAAGFRGREFQPKEPGVFRILALGDSCTFGFAAPSHKYFVSDAYPELLEARIEREHGPRRVEVLNAGTGGYNSYQGLMLLRTQLRGLEPDLITVRFGWNDHLMSREGRGEGAFRESTNPIVRGFWDVALRTALYPFAKRVLIESRARLGRQAPPTLPSQWQPNMSIEEYRYALRAIVQLGRERGAQVWLLTSPQAFYNEARLARYEGLPDDALARKLLIFNAVSSFRRMRDIHESYIAATVQVADALGAPLLDMAAVYRSEAVGRLFSLEDAVHPTQLGHELEAYALYKGLLRAGVLSEPTPDGWRGLER